MKPGDWTYSKSIEDGYDETFDTREQAIAAGVDEHELREGHTLYVGRVVLPTAPRVEAYYAIERAAENAEWPECVFDRFMGNVRKPGPVIDDLQLRIDQAIAAWIDAMQPFGGGFIVDPIEEHVVTADEAFAELDRAIDANSDE